MSVKTSFDEQHRHTRRRIGRAMLCAGLLVVAAVSTVRQPALAQELTIFDNGNIAAVENGPRGPTIVPINQPYIVTYIHTYHYFSGGLPPGQIGLRSMDTGEMYGPWQAVGQVGQGGVPNAYWIVRPNVRIPPGTYRVYDSHRPSWSTNAEVGWVGFATIKGIPTN